MAAKPKGPYTVWQNYGYEGWQPDDYGTLSEAIYAQKYQSEWVLQMPARYRIVETPIELDLMPSASGWSVEANGP